MKKVFIVLGITAAIIAIILAVLPLFKLAYIPVILAFSFGILSFIQARKENSSKTFVQVIFVITILALLVAIYKSVTVKEEVGNIENLQQREKKSEENAIEELENIDIIE